MLVDRGLEGVAAEVDRRHGCATPTRPRVFRGRHVAGDEQLHAVAVAVVARGPGRGRGRCRARDGRRRSRGPRGVPRWRRASPRRRAAARGGPCGPARNGSSTPRWISTRCRASTPNHSPPRPRRGSGLSTSAGRPLDPEPAASGSPPAGIASWTWWSLIPPSPAGRRRRSGGTAAPRRGRGPGRPRAAARGTPPRSRAAGPSGSACSVGRAPVPETHRKTGSSPVSTWRYVVSHTSASSPQPASTAR